MKKSLQYISTICTFTLLLISHTSFSQWVVTNALALGIPGPAAISVASSNIVWAAGGSNGISKVMRSTDGGVTFANVTGNLVSTPEPMCIWAVDANTAYIGDGGENGGIGGNAKIWKTTNGGTNWAVILTTGGTAGFINGIVFSRTNPQTGIIQSDPPTGPGGNYWIQKTTNGGSTWALQSPPGVTGAISAVNTIAVIDDLFYLFGLNNPSPMKIRYTTNGGSSWGLSTTTGIPGPAPYSIAVKDNKLVWLVISNQLPNYGRTSDGGATWTQINAGNSFSNYGFVKYVPGTSVCYLGGNNPSGGCVCKSLDDGLTWAVQTTSSVHELQSLDLIYQGGIVYGYGLSSDGYVIRLAENPIGINNGGNSIPSEYILEQNYPNPFNPSTTVNFSIPKPGETSVTMYDILGNKVMNIFSGYKPAGYYSEQIDASRLASGIYFCRLNSGEFYKTIRISLVK